MHTYVAGPYLFPSTLFCRLALSSARWQEEMLSCRRSCLTAGTSSRIQVRLHGSIVASTTRTCTVLTLVKVLHLCSIQRSYGKLSTSGELPSTRVSCYNRIMRLAAR